MSYQFKVRAHNDFGWGSFSPIATFSTSDVPGAPTSVKTAYNNMNIKISWVAPNNNYLTIDEYAISIRDTTGLVYNTDSTYCDGSDSTIVS